MSNKDHVYAVWSYVSIDENEPHQVLFRRSINRGENFRGLHIIYSDLDEEGLGAYVAAGPEGNVYLAFVRLTKGGTQDTILIYRSTDGGHNFTAEPISGIDIQGMGKATGPKSYLNGTRVNSFPYMAVDNSGTIYIVYTNNTSDEGGDIHVYFRKSTNQGDTWSGATEVNNGQPGVRQWFPSIALDKTDGTIYISYYNMVSGSPNYTTYRNVAISTDEGNNFDFVQVSDVSFVPDGIEVPGYSASFMGDYYEIAAYDGMAYPCWSDNRDGEHSGIFQAYISPIGGAEVTVDQQLSNNSSDGNFDYWSVSSFKELLKPKIYHFKESINHTLRGDQSIVSNEKYNKWSIDNNVVNHREFDFEQGPLLLISRLKPVKSGITIKNNLVEVNNIDAGRLKFKDPWFIKWDEDYNDPPYGYRNLGLDAVYEWVNSPFNPNTSTGYYKGVFLDQQFQDGVFYSLYSAPHDINLAETGRTHRFYWQSWDYEPTKVDFQNQNSASSNIVFNSDNTTITANIKGTNLSNETTAYDNNSQRKFVRTGNGHLHSVYTSMGALWYERSTDGGNTWEIMNGSSPINDDNPKGASITYLPEVSTTDIVLIAYQCTTSTGSDVWIEEYQDGVRLVGNGFRRKVISFAHSQGEYDEINAEPVVALNWGPVYKDFMVVFKLSGILPKINGDNPTIPGLYRCLGGLNPSIYHQMEWYNTPNHTPDYVMIQNTGRSSIHPSLAGQLVTSGQQHNYFHLAYESNYSIYYWEASGQSGTGSLSSSNPINVSSGYGFTQNYDPSIIAMGTGARVCWTGYRIIYNDEEQYKIAEGQEEVSTPQYKVVFRDPDNTSRAWQFGNNVSSPSINKNKYNNYYAFGWSENLNQIKFADNTLSTVRTITDITGQKPQTSNGPDKNNMYCMIYQQNEGLPYYFTMSDDLGSYYPLSKTNYITFTSGREGIISIDSAEFYFSLGDIKVNGQPIDFIEIADSVLVSSLGTLNEYMVTEPFNISDNSDFTYSVQYGINDSLLALQAITGDMSINFKVMLIDDNTGEIIGIHDDVTYNSGNIYQYNNISYSVNTEGIGNRTLRLKLLVENNFTPFYSLSKIYSDVLVLGKTALREINYKGNEVLTTYDISQNYPNPFNPSTTIKYQLPISGIVTLKIFDILGSEVATLVDEFTTQGRYEVNFNAASFASGVYLYRLTVNDYVDVKKMILLK